MSDYSKNRAWTLLRSVGISFAIGISSASVWAGGLQNGWMAFKDSTIQDHGHEWATVGHVGNADWVGPGPGISIVRVGGVDYRYRIAETEVTNRQWYEFVVACAPFLTHAQASDLAFRGLGIGLSGGGGYSLGEPTAEHGAEVGWRYAARYTNWLHNNKVNEAWAFESGVYDTSTFDLPGGSVLPDQRERSEGARYFLPTRDEWAKAVHFDPDRYGEGQEGYWFYPYSSDAMPVAGAPGVSGAQTNAGTTINIPILSYPNAMTPWGLFDASGSVMEWLETINPSQQGRYVAGTGPLAGLEFLDAINEWSQAGPSNLIGIRLASIIPGPGTPLVVCAFGFRLLRRKHRICGNCSFP